MATTRTSRRPQGIRFRAMVLPIVLALFCAASIVSGIFAWRWMQKPTSFPISHVMVEGQFSHVSQKDLQQTIASQLTGGFFSLNLMSLKNKVLTYPWIESVSFRRVWPNTLTVKLEEQKPLARFGVTGVLNTSGQVFYPVASTIPQDLPLLEGPLDQARYLAQFYENASLLVKLIGVSINSLSVDSEHSWFVRLSNDVLVKLGRENAMSRFKQFVVLYPKIVETSKNAVVSVDLRYPDGVAVQFAPTAKTLEK